ncbi:MAG: Gfo/Idh/MocA family oxidoreductase [Ferruginibacter sp.]|nr:Gfo/Idh/MocA family oxidoreductase [Cytophagales bacterium]
METIRGTVNWGIIGCGDVCEVKSGPAFSKIEGSKLVAVMRRDATKAKDYAARHGVARYYDQAHQLIDDEEVNAIYIATPPAFHEAYALMAMQAGKPVYIEKPVSTNSAACQRLIEARQQSQTRVTVAHYRRGLSLFKKAKALLLEGVIGPIRLIRMTTLQSAAGSNTAQVEDNWRINPTLSGGGLFHDLAPHQLDILYWIFGAPREVRGRALNQSGLYQAPDMTTVEAVFAHSVCLSGVWAFNVGASAAEEQCEIIGARGTLRFSFFKKSDLIIDTDSGTQRLAFTYPENIQHPMIAEVVKFFKGEGPNPCSLEEALVSMNMMDSTGVFNG